MNLVLTAFKSFAEKVVGLLKEDVKIIRTGRATPALIEDLLVQTYGEQTTLKLTELATITTDGPSALVIAPFDPTTIQDIEKSILKSSLGFSPIVQGTKILVKIPPLSQEQREKIKKFIGQKVEEKKVMIRNRRDEARKKIKSMLEKKEITEDEKFRFEKETDSVTQNYMKEINTIKENKEKEIMEV